MKPPATKPDSPAAGRAPSIPRPLRTPSHTALAALPVLALDLETTGLDVANDRIVQIGAVAMHGRALRSAPRIDTHVDPGVAIPAGSTRIHGLTDARVAGAPRFAELVEPLREALGRRVVVGQHIRFDLAVLRHEAARAGAPWSDPPALDVTHLAGALDRGLVGLGLEALAERFGVSVEERHDALGDALTAAGIFAALIPRLREADVRTLGEAEAFAARCTELVHREVEAGWRRTSGDAPDPPPPSGLARIDSFLYQRRLDEVMAAPVRAIRPEGTLRQAARMMTEHRIGALLVVGDDPRPTGIVTERDLLRAATDPHTDPDGTTVSSVMSAPVRRMRGEEMLYRALGRMDRLGVRHLCVADASGAPVGMVSQRDLLHHRASAAAELGDAVACADDAAALAAAHGRLTDVAAGLMAEGVGAAAAARIVSSELRALTGRAAAIAVAGLEAEGYGPAPARWCVLVLGSGGRGESLLSADQDNALVHAGAEEDDGWFAALGARLADLLDEAGVRRCRGGIMASNREWRGSLPAWRERVDGWLRRATPDDLLHVDVFYDLVPVAGALGLGRDLHTAAVEAARGSRAFLASLAESVAAKSAPVGLFGRLRTQDGRVDLKLGGLLPLVGVARTLALRIGSPARSTPERIEAAAAAGRVSPGDAAALIRIHGSLLTLILRQQLEDLSTGVPPSGRVAAGRLARSEQRSLVRDLRRLDGALRVLRSSVAG